MAVISDHILVTEGIEERAMTNDGVTAGIVLKEGMEEKLAGDRVRIVLSHVDFSPDNVAFGLEVFLRKTGEEDQFKENTDKGAPGGAGTVDVVNGPVKGGVGIPLPAFSINPGSQFRSGEGSSSLEYHVFKQV